MRGTHVCSEEDIVVFGPESNEGFEMEVIVEAIEQTGVTVEQELQLRLWRGEKKK